MHDLSWLCAVSPVLQTSGILALQKLGQQACEPHDRSLRCGPKRGLTHHVVSGTTLLRRSLPACKK